MTYVPKSGFTLEHTIASDVADDATFTTAYPSGSAQGDFDSGNYKAGEGHIMVAENTKWSDADPGIEFTTFGASTITFTNRTGATLTAGTKIRVWLPVWATAPIFMVFPISLASVADGDVVTNIRPGVNGYITHVEFVTGVAVTTGSKLSTLNLEIGTTNLTGGAVALTSAALTPKGARVAGTRITANNRILRASTLSVEASSTTAFAEGDGFLIVKIQPDVP